MPERNFQDLTRITPARVDDTDEVLGSESGTRDAGRFRVGDIRNHPPPDDSVTDAKIPAGANVSGQKLADGSVTRDKLDANSRVDANFREGVSTPIPGSRIARGTRTAGFVPKIQGDGEATWSADAGGVSTEEATAIAHAQAQLAVQGADHVAFGDDLPTGTLTAGDLFFVGEQLYLATEVPAATYTTSLTPGDHPTAGNDDRGFHRSSPAYGGIEPDLPWLTYLIHEDTANRVEIRLTADRDPGSVRARLAVGGTFTFANLNESPTGVWSGNAPGQVASFLQAQQLQVTTTNSFIYWRPVSIAGGAGTRGPEGPAGPQGEQGPPGPAGPKGDDGDRGPAGAASTVPGPQGPAGAQGPAGQGVPAGGTTGQVLKKTSSANYATAWRDDEVGTGGGGTTLTQANVYAQVKEIIQAGSGITISENDGSSELTLFAPISQRLRDIEGYFTLGGWANYDTVEVATTYYENQPTPAQAIAASFSATTQQGARFTNRWILARVPIAQAALVTGNDLRIAVLSGPGDAEVFAELEASSLTEISRTASFIYLAGRFADIPAANTVRVQQHREVKLNPQRVKVEASDVEVDASGFDGNLSSTDTNLQLVAQRVDDLVIASGGGGGGEATPPYTQIGNQVIVQRGPRWQFQAPLTASPVIPDDVDFFAILIDGERSSPTAQWDQCSIFVTVDASTFRNLPAATAGSAINGRATGVDGTANFGNYRFINKTPQEIWGDRVSFGRTSTNGLLFASNDAAADTDQQFRLRVFRINSVGGGGAAAQPTSRAQLPRPATDEQLINLTADDVWRQDYGITWNAEATNLIASATPAGVEAVRWYSADSGNPVALRSRVAIQDSTSDTRTPAALWVDNTRYAATRASQALQHFYLVDSSLTNPTSGSTDDLNVEFTDGSFSRSQDVTSGQVQYDATADSWAHTPGIWTLPQVRAQTAPWARSGQPFPNQELHDATVAINITNTNTNGQASTWNDFATPFTVGDSDSGVITFAGHLNDWATSAGVRAVRDEERLESSAISLGRLRGFTADTQAFPVLLFPIYTTAGAVAGTFRLELRRATSNRIQYRTLYLTGTGTSAGNLSGTFWLTALLARSA